MESSEQWSSSTDVTVLLERVRQGDHEARGLLLDQVYDELRALARAVMGNGAGHTLQPTALVHEVWIKVSRGMDAITDRTHFFALAATAMRQVLADHARTARRLKRGGDNTRVVLHDDVAHTGDADLLVLSDSLDRLRGLNERHARVLELRIFGGLTIAEAAMILGVSPGTIKSDWVVARAWLGDELTRS